MKRGGGRRGPVTAAAATAVLLAAGLTLGRLGLRGHDGPPQPSAPAAATASATHSTPTESERRPTRLTGRTDDVDLGPVLPASRPVRLLIASIQLSAGNLLELGTNADGSLQVPEDFDRAGWWTPGPTPGQLGPAVIAGHVDSTRGPAVFYRLGQLRRGDEVRVQRADGRVARFAVDRVNRFAKDDFPTTQVYGNTTNRAELRLITCGGDFDRRSGHYLDNVVAFAHLVG